VQFRFAFLFLTSIRQSLPAVSFDCQTKSKPPPIAFSFLGRPDAFRLLPSAPPCRRDFPPAAPSFPQIAVVRSGLWVPPRRERGSFQRFLISPLLLPWLFFFYRCVSVLLSINYSSSSCHQPVQPLNVGFLVCARVAVLVLTLRLDCHSHAQCLLHPIFYWMLSFFPRSRTSCFYCGG